MNLMSLHVPWQAMCHYSKPHRDFFLIQIFFAGPLLMTELQNGAIGYPSTAWQMVWERSKTMRLICMKRRVTDLFTHFFFPATEGEKAEVSQWLFDCRSILGMGWFYAFWKLHPTVLFTNILIFLSCKFVHILAFAQFPSIHICLPLYILVWISSSV